MPQTNGRQTGANTSTTASNTARGCSRSITETHASTVGRGKALWITAMSVSAASQLLDELGGLGL